MSLSRRYQLLPDRAVCMSHGCPWHRDGADAEQLAEAHTISTRHEVHVQAGSKVIFTIAKSPAAVMTRA